MENRVNAHKIAATLYIVACALLLLLFALAGRYVYDIIHCVGNFGVSSDDCNETISFILVFIAPIWLIAAALLFDYLPDA